MRANASVAMYVTPTMPRSTMCTPREYMLCFSTAKSVMSLWSLRATFVWLSTCDDSALLRGRRASGGAAVDALHASLLANEM